MKKLNRKGFTLVELLAVIIILAIVVGITIPAVLTTISNTRTKAFEAAVSSVADWIDRQYNASLVGDNTIATVDAAFTSGCPQPTGNDTAITCTVTDTLLAAAGVKPSNFISAESSITITISTGRSCVSLKGSTSGDYQSDASKTGGICTS